MGTTETLVADRSFCQGPRWHQGRFFLSDVHDRVVLSVGLDGSLDEVVRVDDDRPSGLGWLPDGRLLVAATVSRQVRRLEADGRLVLHADLSSHTAFLANDMVVDAAGRSYVGHRGFDLEALIREVGLEGALGEPGPPRASLVRVDPDGTVSVAADDLRCPNGTLVTPAGDVLVVAETLGLRLTAFDIAGDGSLSNRRLWAPTGLVPPDGICLDVAGAIWVASPMGPEVVRLAQGGEVLDRVETSQPAFACALGGDDGRTLLVCTAPTSGNRRASSRRDGRLEVVEVEVPAP